jgi:hypothetical protein
MEAPRGDLRTLCARGAGRRPGRPYIGSRAMGKTVATARADCGLLLVRRHLPAGRYAAPKAPHRS